MDLFKNFPVATLNAGITSGATSIPLVAGHGARLPASAFNAVIWNSTDYSTPADAYHAGAAEIVRITAGFGTDALTATRAQESTAAVAHNTVGKTYKLAQTITAKTLNTDITSGTNHYDTFAGNGVQTAFTLLAAPANSLAIVLVNGLAQTPTTDFTISGTTLTFVVAPANPDIIGVFYSAPAGVVGGDMELAVVQTVTAVKNFNDGTLKLVGATSGAATLKAPAVAGTAEVILPGASATLATLGLAETLALKTLTRPKIGTSIDDTAGNELVKVTATASAVNEITFANAATGADPIISATGDDANVGINLVPKGTGTVKIGGLDVGTKIIPQNSQSADYTAVSTDSGKAIFHPSADTTARVFTLPANASVAYPIGTALTFINQNGAGVVTIAITTDTLRLAGAGTTGSRTLAANGIATAIKVTATEWLISGTGLT